MGTVPCVVGGQYCCDVNTHRTRNNRGADVA
jgi:hypothetical protein